MLCMPCHARGELLLNQSGCEWPSSSAQQSLPTCDFSKLPKEFCKLVYWGMQLDRLAAPWACGTSPCRPEYSRPAGSIMWAFELCTSMWLSASWMHTDEEGEEGAQGRPVVKWKRQEVTFPVFSVSQPRSACAPFFLHQHLPVCAAYTGNDSPSLLMACERGPAYYAHALHSGGPIHSVQAATSSPKCPIRCCCSSTWSPRVATAPQEEAAAFSRDANGAGMVGKAMPT
jgi:hypothetical protein